MPFKPAFALCRHHTPCHSLLGLGFGSMSHDEQSPFTPHAAAVIAAALTRIGLRSPDALLLSLLDIVARGHSRSHTRPRTSPRSRTLHTHATHTLPQRSLLIVRSLPRSARSMHRCSPPRSPHIRCCLQGCTVGCRRCHALAHRNSSGTHLRCFIALHAY